MGYQKSILFAEMGKWYDKKVTQSRIVNVDCIIASSRVKMVYFWHFFLTLKNGIFKVLINMSTK